ncbi:hypothetical protein NCC49_006363 [Naganishia albida]|nr:hypothetical protein NCC49_006363 [Naganishia albida]
MLQGYRDHIRANLHRTPVDIANDLREQFRLGNNVAFGPPPDTQVVGFWWREYNNTRWEVDQGSTVQESVEKVLGKVKGVVQMEMESLSEGGVVDTIAWICEGMIEKIGITNIMEVALDGRHGVSTSKHELLTVMAEYDGSGYPLAYLLRKTTKAAKTQALRESIAKARHATLTHLFTEMKRRGVAPSFVGTDKDFQEIRAVNAVWPEAKHQLCYWHAKRALEKRLRQPPSEVTSYDPFRAAADSDSFCPPAHHDGILQLFAQHLNQHASIPLANVGIVDATEIRRRALVDIYKFCFNHDLPELWAYLYMAWYRPEVWVLWARSASPEIPVLRTTMIVESHWRLIKRDYLGNKRPTLPSLVYTLCHTILPRSVGYIGVFGTGADGKHKSSWRKTFKAEYGIAEKAKLTTPSQQYFTDQELGVCGCPSFLLSRFLLCKHLYRGRRRTPHWYHTVRRFRQAPFWREPMHTAHDTDDDDPDAESMGLHDLGGEQREGNHRRVQPASADADDVASGPMDDIRLEDCEDSDAELRIQQETEKYEASERKKESIQRRMDQYFRRQWDVNADSRGVASLVKRLDMVMKEFERKEEQNVPTWGRANRHTMFTQ